jgi:hypothetical protein
MMGLPFFLACDHLANGQPNAILIGEGALGTISTGTSQNIATSDGIKGIRWSATGTFYHTPLFAPRRRVIVGLRHRFGDGGLPNLSTHQILIGFRTGGTLQLNATRPNTPSIAIRRGTTVLETIPGYGDATWRYVELVADIHPTDGSYELWIDGVMVTSATGVNTGSADVDNMCGGAGQAGINNSSTHWYVKEWESETEPGRYGPLAFNFIQLDSDDSNDNWAPDTGTELFSRINAPHPGAGHIETQVLGARAKFGVEDLPAGINSIIAVVPVTVSQAPAGGAPRIACGAETGAGILLGDSAGTGLSGARTQTFALMEKPGGGGWTTAAVNEAKLVLDAVS